VSANRGLKGSPPAYLEGETLHRHRGARAVPFTTTDACTRHLVFRAGQSSPRIGVSLKRSITTCDWIGACSAQLRRRLVARSDEGTIRTLPRTLDQRSRAGRGHPPPLVDGDAPSAIAAALAGVVAVSVQNAASRTVFASLSPTTVMTGNVTQLVIDAVDLAGGATVDASAAIRARMRRFWPPVVSFAGGAVAGAVGFSKFGFGALTLPAVFVLYLAIDTRRWANP